jgi:PhnB protein
MHVVIVADDPHAVYEHAIAAGATVERPVQDEPYGWRIGKLRDPFGHKWEIGKLLK